MVVCSGFFGCHLDVNLFAEKVCFDEVGIYLGKSSVRSGLLGFVLAGPVLAMFISPPSLDPLALPTRVVRSFMPTITATIIY